MSDESSSENVMFNHIGPGIMIHASGIHPDYGFTTYPPTATKEKLSSLLKMRVSYSSYCINEGELLVVPYWYEVCIMYIRTPLEPYLRVLRSIR